jgi:hypothetical protein
MPHLSKWKNKSISLKQVKNGSQGSGTVPVIHCLSNTLSPHMLNLISHQEHSIAKQQLAALPEAPEQRIISHVNDVAFAQVLYA